MGMLLWLGYEIGVALFATAVPASDEDHQSDRGDRKY